MKDTGICISTVYRHPPNSFLAEVKKTMLSHMAIIVASGDPVTQTTRASAATVNSFAEVLWSQRYMDGSI